MFALDDAQVVLAEVFGEAITRQALHELIARPFVCRDPTPAPADRLPSVVVLDSIREWLLESVHRCAQWPAVSASHARLFRRRTQEAFTLARGGDSASAFAVFAPVERNIDAALDWQLAQHDAAAFLSWCTEVSLVRLMCGTIRPALARLRTAVDVVVVDGDEASHHSAWCCYLLSRALTWLDDPRGAVHALRLARRRSIGTTDALLLEKIATHLGAMRAEQLYLRAASMHIDAAIRRSERANASGASSSLLSVCSAVLVMRGEHPQALAVARRALVAALKSGNPINVWLTQQQLFAVALRHGLLDQAHDHDQECAHLETVGAVSRVPEVNLQFLRFFLHFECEDYALAKAFLENARRLEIDAQLDRSVEVDLGLEFILIETGRSDEAVAIAAADDASYALKGEFISFYVQLHCYRLRLQAQRGDRIAALVSLACALHPIRRSRNRLWASWLAGALAGMAADQARHGAARRLVRQAQALQRDGGIEPSPRQRASWQRVGNADNTTPALRAVVPAQGEPPRPVIEVAAELEAWARRALATPPPSRGATGHPREPARAVR